MNHWIPAYAGMTTLRVVTCAGKTIGHTSPPHSSPFTSDASRIAPDRTAVTGVVLAGGLGRRMGGIDKGLQAFRGRPMVQWVIERLAPQVGAVLINANQNLSRYREFGAPVIADAVGGFAGPLAGLHRAMQEAATPLLVTVPCDSPFLPLDLVARLRDALILRKAQVAVARTGDQAHPVFCLAQRDLLPHLQQFLDAGGRKIDAWYATLRLAEVAFDDQPDAFSNFNTLDELRAAESGKN
jgi:molybdopterin-guanine dinucleotide biosynthesis protein A